MASLNHTCEWKDGHRVGRASCERCMAFETHLWDVINRYAASVGGDPSAHVYGNKVRMQAVTDLNETIDKLLRNQQTAERVIDEVVKGSEAASRHALELREAVTSQTIYVTHVYNNADKLHDFYVHQLAQKAVRHAANDVVNGRFENGLDPDDFETELVRVVKEVIVEPKTNRRHVRCDAWHAVIDEMKVLV
jgi:predicted RNA-binding Zn ribbon-like protein